VQYLPPMKLIEWRQDMALVKQASDILNDPFVKRMLETIRDETPQHYPLPKTGVADGDRTYQLGLIDGAHYMLLALQKP